MAEIRTYDSRKVDAVKQKGNEVWEEIHNIIRGKQFSGFERISIPMDFSMKFNGYTRMQVLMNNDFLPNGKLRVFLKNGQESLGINISRGYISPVSREKQTFGDISQMYQLRLTIFEMIKPVIQGLSKALVEAPVFQRPRKEIGNRLKVSEKV